MQNYVSLYAEMELQITEVQITCAVIMGLLTLLLAYFLPKHMTEGRYIHHARKLLVNGTFLSFIHFLIQYLLQKYVHDISGIRTIINLLFGIPISYFCSISYLYMVQQGKIRKLEWWLGPIVLAMACLMLFFCVQANMQGFPYTTYTISIFYGFTLLYYRIILIKYIFKKRIDIAENKDLEISQFIKWTKWSILFLIIVAFGFPLVAFCTNTNLRFYYAILAISASFFYVVNFIGYCLTYHGQLQEVSIKIKEQILDREENTTVTTTENMDQMKNIIEKFIKNDVYSTPGITLKDAAIAMGISCNKLRMWLRISPYGKFSNWIVSLRIEKAKELLLRYPQLNNEEIAEKCGFCDRQYFQYQFSKKEGITPAKWLKQHCNTAVLP